jgi:cysteine desulfurase
VRAAGAISATGSACHADSEEPSEILTALGLPREVALGAVRLSLGRATTMDDIAGAATSLGSAWRTVSNAAMATAV